MSVIEERRRTPRFSIVGGELAVLPVPVSVRLLDISLSGVLLHVSEAAKPGMRAQLRLDLAGKPFAATVEVSRIAPGPDGRGFKLGARFVDLSDDQKQVIESFTRR